jgi:hypothetical protein
VTFRPTLPTCSLVDAVYNSNRLVADDAVKSDFDASRVLVRSDMEGAGKIAIVNRFWIEAVAAPLVKPRADWRWR